MPVAIILGALAGAMLLAAGGERGSRAMLGRVGPLPARRVARFCGFALLGATLWLMASRDGNVPFALVGWTLACGPAFVAAALVCTLLDQRRGEGVRSPRTDRRPLRQAEGESVPAWPSGGGPAGRAD